MLASMVLASVSCDEAEPAPLEQLPLSVALDYVYRHPEYVLVDPDSSTVESEPPTQEDAEIGRRLAGDWVARTLREENLDASDHVAWAWRSIELTRATIFSQRHPNLYLDFPEYVDDEGFADLAFARLVRGATNCHGFNFTLAMLLRAKHSDTAVLGIADSPDGEHEGGHSLAAIPGDGGWIFVDAWSDFGVMVLSQPVASDLPTWGELDLGPTEGLYAEVQYEHVVDHSNLDIEFGTRLDDEPDLGIPDDLPPPRDARDVYLRGRVLELYGYATEASALYQQTIALTCHDPSAPLCVLAGAFIERARDGG
ncbi:hypothetical protein DB30_00375 [Enhygromyxa salina]|uniref:Transglutaminase-like domain-containing protein n=1 Tax=Enhygromyxa salina TaxID=215803 RepID=A0A0C2CUM2_9BACT|nr:hypothetical protein [Enhygromyxa salina]KIG13280.1 hypothetical protein DB30_00375 [Enhygromyxa salina]